MIKRKRRLNKQAIISGLEFYVDKEEHDLLVMNRFSGYKAGAIFHSSVYPKSKYSLQYYFSNKNLNIFTLYPLELTNCVRITK